jgi:hypothetical protein
VPRVEGTQLQPGRYYPAITFQLKVNGKVRRGLGIIDSGADLTMIPAEMLIGSGIDFGKLPLQPGQNVGAGGSHPRRCPGQIDYASMRICDEFVVAEEGTLPFAIFGREDFFTKFVVRFNWHKSPPEVHLDPVATGGKR